MQTTVYKEWISNKVLLYSTGNYIQYLMINHNGKEYTYVYICVCMCVCVYIYMYIYIGFPDSSVGKESSCNAGDPGSIPGSGRSTGEGIGYPLQCSWASLVAQLVKNRPAMWETWV